MPPRRWAIVWAAASWSVVLAIGLQLPLWVRLERIWIADDFYRVEKESVPIWKGLTERRPSHLDQFETSWTRARNRNTCLALLAVAGGVGAVVYWVRRPRTRPAEADDYSDGPSGSAPDGRVPQ
jgi:hypothetical protein